MIMEPLVALCGQQTLLHTDVEHVGFLHACPYVQNVFKRAIMKGMISICLGLIFTL